MPAIKDEIGNKYNHLVVIEEGEKKNNRRYWICECEICKKNTHFLVLNYALIKKIVQIVKKLEKNMVN